jgi:hypothetical protein
MMTDAEINLAIAKIEYPDKEIASLDNGSAFVAHQPTSGVKNYIKYWGDIGPIIDSEKMTVGYNDTERLYFAHDGYGNNGAFETTPTKAACLCYLKMKGG